MAHFFLGDLSTSGELGATAAIEGAEARHAVTVSRLAVGESISIGDGAGRVATGRISGADPSRLEIQVEQLREVPKPSPAIFLAQALAKGDRDELAIQAATELGVDGVIPWAAARSISRWEGRKVTKGLERWAAVVREATKQSMRAWLPDVLDLATTKQLAALASSTRMLVLDPAGDSGLAALEPDDRDIVVLVGPEGGISPGELELLRAAGASVVRLGDTVLRTSTAGPAAIAVLSAKLGRWR